MAGFWGSFKMNEFSFWIGFLTGILFFWIFQRLLPSLRRSIPWVKSKISDIQTRNITKVEKQYREELLRIAQKMHLASAIFSLDEILIEPEFLLPHKLLADEEYVFEDLPNQILPYMPDWPEIAAEYQAQTVSISDILKGGANIALIGQPGIGKTVALAHLACLVARRSDRAGSVSNRLPIYLHVADLLHGEKTEIRPFDRIQSLLQSQFPRISPRLLRRLIREQFISGNTLLLLDGYDELPSSDQLLTTKLIASVLKEYPGTRVVAAADVLDFSGLKDLQIVPILISPWSNRQRQKFLKNWGELWQRELQTVDDKRPIRDEKYLMNSWLLTDTPFSTPLETTLKVWAVYAGDLTGPSPLDTIDLYIRRITGGNASESIGLQELAIRMVSSLKLTGTLIDPKVKTNLTVEPVVLSPALQADQSIKKVKKRAQGNSTNRINLLITRPSGMVAFIHPVITAYLAAKALAQAPIMHYLEKQPDWVGKRLTLGYLHAWENTSFEVNEVLGKDRDPLYRAILSEARWLHIVPEDSQWRLNMLKFLAEKSQKSNLPLGLRCRLLAALLCSQDIGLSVLFRTMLKSAMTDIRLIAILGLGFIKDQNSVEMIAELISGRSPAEARAACLALSAIGTRQAIDYLGTTLLSGEDKVKTYAAAALSYHQPDGHDMLKEGSQMNDFLVRRAVLQGLVRIKEPWSRAIIEKLALEDDQWVVRDAAAQALEHLKVAVPHPPRSSPELSEAAWLIEFASSKGLGVAPDKSARDMLFAVLREGNPKQKREALDYLRLNGDAEIVPEITNCLHFGDRLTREAAFDTLWHNAALGLELPQSILV